MIMSLRERGEIFERERERAPTSSHLRKTHQPLLSNHARKQLEALRIACLMKLLSLESSPRKEIAIDLSRFPHSSSPPRAPSPKLLPPVKKSYAARRRLRSPAGQRLTQIAHR